VVSGLQYTPLTLSQISSVLGLETNKQEIELNESGYYKKLIDRASFAYSWQWVKQLQKIAGIF
jgi:hypothetical protein